MVEKHWNDRFAIPVSESLSPTAPVSLSVNNSSFNNIPQAAVTMPAQ